MTKPVIYLQEKLKLEQIEQIKAVSNDYLVIDSTDEDTSFNKEDIVIMLGWNHSFGPELLKNPNSRLKWVQSISAGVDSLDLQTFSENEILLSNASGIHKISIAEHVLGVLLAEFRGLRRAIKANSWTNREGEFKQLSEQNMLIVGTGQIGQQLASFAQAMKIRTYGINSTGHPASGFSECYSQKNLSKIVKDMDIVVNILPLTNKTYHLYDEEMFQAMKKGTIFVNVGRGPSVKTEALVDALQSNQISFAALDVFEKEPLPDNHPFWTMDNVLITSHTSGITPKFKQKLTDIFLTNLTSFVETGKLKKNQINLEKGY
ncbi:phosphoglycerate dehydrogenase [Enterococcus sp. BWT-B8]|uniref:phosphoglycerate dehydrogenase n=1 Tax=Enterococcus sp. BWT-B8 TaxID=2885157 RepID=UPI001E631D0A|nr:phosphoglycerate dehydrogenase [Enterococcus sp. BWT-B8]MCB5951553.1 phosphoglycerate dehydrogenase [Enterococcus sp. BWT-B8]